jgi:hypothetical protein
MKIMPGVGNFRDNEAALLVAAASINSGDAHWGEQILIHLRDHIMLTGESKSVHQLLPRVLDVLKAAPGKCKEERLASTAQK